MPHMKPSFVMKKGTSEKTNDYYITDVEIATPYIYCYGRIKAGSYLCTCPIYGVAMVAGAREVAFAVALEGKDDGCIQPIKIKLLEGDKNIENAKGDSFCRHI